MNNSQQRLAIVMHDGVDAIISVAKSQNKASGIFATHMSAFHAGLNFAVRYPEAAQELNQLLAEHQSREVTKAANDLSKMLHDLPPEELQLDDFPEFVQENMKAFLA